MIRNELGFYDDEVRVLAISATEFVKIKRLKGFFFGPKPAGNYLLIKPITNQWQKRIERRVKFTLHE